MNIIKHIYQSYMLGSHLLKQRANMESFVIKSKNSDVYILRNTVIKPKISVLDYVQGENQEASSKWVEIYSFD